MKMRILFVYDEMIVGGSTTSLISLLENLDYQNYDVDLLLYYNKGALIDKLPKEVNLLSEASIYSKKNTIIKFIKALLNGSLIRALYYGLKIDKKLSLNNQAMAYARLANSRKIEEKYDVAIGFLEGWPNCQVAHKVNAGKKLIWIHPDFKESKMSPDVDKRTFEKVDHIVLVSNSNLEHFNQLCPAFMDKSVCINNIVSEKKINELSGMNIDCFVTDKSKVNLVTVSRIDFKSKGLDRAVMVFNRLKKSGHSDNLHWYIIGGGQDFSSLKEMIQTHGLENDITLLGEKKNPFPYLRKMDAFFLPSRYEGEPMSVNESLILKVPVIVTDYASARVQVKDGKNGIVIENSEQGIYQILKDINTSCEIITKLNNYCLSNDYKSNNQISDLYKLFDGPYRENPEMDI